MKIEEIEKVLSVGNAIGGTLKTKSSELPLNEVYSFTKGKFNVIAARSGKGKSKLMASKAFEESSSKSVLFLSSEMKGTELNNLFKEAIPTLKNTEISLMIGEADSVLNSKRVCEIVSSVISEGFEAQKVYVDHFELDKNQSLEQALLEISNLGPEFVLSMQLSRSSNENLFGDFATEEDKEIYKKASDWEIADEDLFD